MLQSSQNQKDKDNPVASLSKEECDFINCVLISYPNGGCCVGDSHDCYGYPPAKVREILSKAITILNYYLPNARETDNRQPLCECGHYGFYEKLLCIDCHRPKPKKIILKKKYCPSYDEFKGCYLEKTGSKCTCG